MNNYHYRRKSKSKIPMLIALILLIAGSVYIYLSDNFERIAPTIKIDEKIYWNLMEPIPGSKRGDIQEYQADRNRPSVSQKYRDLNGRCHETPDRRNGRESMEPNGRQSDP